MVDNQVLNYAIKDPIELNFSYMPFINEGGLFIPSFDNKYSLGDIIHVELQLPARKSLLMIQGKVVWITPKNALHHVLPGIGIQFMGTNAPDVKLQIEAELDKSMEVGGYTYGITEEGKRGT